MRCPVGCVLLELLWVRDFFHNIRSQMEHRYPILLVVRFICVVNTIPLDRRKLLCREGKSAPSTHKQRVVTKVHHPLVELHLQVRHPLWLVNFNRRWRTPQATARRCRLPGAPRAWDEACHTCRAYSLGSKYCTSEYTWEKDEFQC